MDSQTNRYLLNELLKAWNEHNLDSLVGLFAHDYQGIDVAQAEPIYGAEGVRASFERYFCAFPDIHFTSENVIVEDNDALMGWHAQGTHDGTFMHIPPTGRFISVRGVTILKIANGKIHRGQHVWDVAGLLRGIGLLPDLFQGG